MRLLLCVMAVVSIVGCEKDKPIEKHDKDRFEGPMPVVLGDCAGPTVGWISGPRPQPFTVKEADAVYVAAVPPSDPVPDAAAGSGSGSAAKPPDRTAGILGSAALVQGGAFASLTGTGDVSAGFDDSNIYGGLLGNEPGDMNGGFGFGRAGFGPGGGGTGWGTIGTGRYGTIGHGAGYGSAGMRGRTGAVPTISIGQPNTQGDLDKAIIRRYIKRHLNEFSYCYEKQLLAKPQLEGTVSTQFFIDPKGTVDSAMATGVDPEVASCVASVIKSIEFPKPKGGGGVQVSYPFTFRPASGSGGAGSGSNDSPPPPPDIPPMARAMFRPDPPALDPKYQPGSANPLRGETAALTDCFRQGSKRYGVAVVELHYDASGAVTSALAHGVEDDGVRTCVVEAAKHITRSAPRPAAERCSLAYGQMPPAALPAIDIAASSIMFEGKALGAQGEPLSELVTSIARNVRAAIAVSAPVVALHGPLLVRPTDATPMNAVMHVLNNVAAAGDDSVLAAQRGSAWQPLTAITLPIVPVPFSTGAKWSRLKSDHPSVGIAIDPEHVVLSVLVTTDRIFVGISRLDQFFVIPRDAGVADKLASTLKEQKASSFFTDRTDIEIAADDTVTYGDVVKVIDEAVKDGFVDWTLTTPDRLAARPAL